MLNISGKHTSNMKWFFTNLLKEYNFKTLANRYYLEYQKQSCKRTPIYQTKPCINLMLSID